MSDEPVLDIRHLTIRAGDGRTLVEDLNLRAEAGEHVALIGESGSGKSLTSVAVMGLLPAGLHVAGSIRVCGQEVVGTPDRITRQLRGTRMGIVFQEPMTALDPLVRLGNQLGEAIGRAAAADGHRLTRRGRRSAVREALGAVRIHQPDRIARAYPHEASGGQRQRVAIAMASAAHPDLLILDEPTTALDVTVQAEVLHLLRDLIGEHRMTTLFVSHDLAVVATMADTAVVLRAGRAVETGRFTDLLSAPRQPYTRRLIEAARALDAAMDGGADS